MNTASITIALPDRSFPDDDAAAASEGGTIAIAFDMRVQDGLDRHPLVMDVISRVPGLGSKGASLEQRMADRLTGHKHHIGKHGGDRPETRDWMWNARA